MNNRPCFSIPTNTNEDIYIIFTVIDYELVKSCKTFGSLQEARAYIETKEMREWAVAIDQLNGYLIPI